MNRKTTSEILQRAKDTLRTAKFGLDEFINSTSPHRKLAGLRNLIVFGRAVTNVLQNLRSTEKDFDDWYQPYREQMEADPVMDFFYKERSKILKEGTTPDYTYQLYIKSFSTDELGPPPPNAKGFFIGDNLGGSGWQIELPDGSNEKYYVELRSDQARLKTFFSSFYESNNDDSLKKRSAEDLAQYYFSFLEKMVNDAVIHFTKRS